MKRKLKVSDVIFDTCNTAVLLLMAPPLPVSDLLLCGSVLKRSNGTGGGGRIHALAARHTV